MTRLVLLLWLPAALAVASPAFGQDEEVPLVEPPIVCCGAPPKDGKLTLKFLNGLRHDGRQYLTEGQLVKVRGRAKPYVKGQRVTVRVTREGRKVVTKRLRLKKVKGRNAGQFVIRFTAGAQAMYKVRAVHKRTARQRKFSASERRRALDNTASYGSRGVRVLLLQKGLRKLGYVGFTNTGFFGPGTARAVLAFRKVNGLGRSSYASTEVFRRVFQGRGTYKLKYPNAGKHLEADMSRQVLVLAKDGRAVRIYHTSSGKPSTPTVLGSFKVYRKSPGTNSHGMVHSSYFIGGYAIHGYRSVPNYPASHGCLRVPIPSAWKIYSWIDFGDPVFVYR